MAEIVAMARPRHLRQRAVGVVGVGVLVDVRPRCRRGSRSGRGRRRRRRCTRRDRTSAPRALPSRRSNRRTRTRAQPAPMPRNCCLDVRDQLVHDRVAVGPEIGRVHRVRIVVVGIRVLDLDDQHARKVRAGPFLVELVGGLLLDPVVAIEVKAFAVVARDVRVGRRLAQSADVAGKVAVVDDRADSARSGACRSLRASRTCAPRYMARPQNFVSRSLRIRSCLMYFVVGRLGHRRNDLVERRCGQRRRARGRSAIVCGVL